MDLYLTVRTTIRDLVIDFIEVELTNGEVVSLNWDESGIERTADGFYACYSGVYFGEEYANGRIDELRSMRIAVLGIYTEEPNGSEITITEMSFEDAGNSYRPEFLPYTVNEKECEHT